jgi:transcriptional regulator with XRE-family HTH domain
MKNNFRTSLGLKQEELAQLLQVSRSQLSLYELGKRSLPLPALEKLAFMLQLSQKNAPKSEKKKNNAIEEQKLLQKLILKNSHQQLLVEQKIKAFEKKQNAQEASKKIISFLVKDEFNGKKNDLALLKSISAKTENSITNNSATKLLELQIKKEVLAFESDLLREKMKENEIKK